MNKSFGNNKDEWQGMDALVMKIKRLGWYRKLAYSISTILIFVLLLSGTVTPGKAQNGYITDVREIETADELSITSPVGLAYSPAAGVFELMDSGVNGANNPAIVEMTMYEQLAGKATVVDNFSNPLNIAFNGKSNSLFHLNQGANTLDQIPADTSGKLPASANVSARYDIKAYGLAQAEGMTFNPADGTLYLLDPAGKRMVRITPDASGNYDSTPANSQGRIQRVDLKSLGASHLRGIAFNPSNGHLYITGPKEKLLFEITEAGTLVDTYDLAEFTLSNPGAMVFAPSGDNTDDPAIQDLFIADSGQTTGQASGSGQVLELTMTAPTLLASLPALRTDISLAQPVIQTSKWSPPSPDPSGIEYRSNGELFVTDSEVDEMTIWKGANVFRSTTDGTLLGTCNATSFSKEVAGTAENPTNGHIFISDDGRKRLFEIDLGPDGKYCTSDDTVKRSDAYALYNDTDPEGVGYGAGKLFLTDGMGTEVYAIAPGNNGTFGDSDDQVTHWDTSGMGIRDPEGIDYSAARNSLFIVSYKDNVLVETTVDGTVLNRWDTTPFKIVHAAGVGCGPNSIFVSARGVDNNKDPNENDGKIYEFTVGN